MLDFHPTGDEEKRDGGGRVGQARTVSPTRGAKIRKPSGNTRHQGGNTALRQSVLTLALVEFTQEILPVAFLRKLMSLQGQQALELFNRWFHCV